jgi:hypothetical protein
MESLGWRAADRHEAAHIATASQARYKDETTSSRFVRNYCRPFGVPILNSTRMSTLKLCAAAEIE